MTPNPIDDYLQRAEALWSEGTHLPDAEALRQLAIDAGFNAELSEHADARALEATAQARDLLAIDDPDAAEPHLRQAVLLSPVRLEAHMLLASLYARRFETSGDTELRQQARQLALRCQELSPKHTPSAELLKELGMVEQRDTMSWKQAALITAILVGISASMSLCVRYTMVPPEDENAREEVREHFEQTPPPQELPSR
ncbi:hypothetical protein FRC96_13700 [Lujinxingia vulgaris]|uniref:Tetratricopeptide repeat protein n=1 Tax=Lujinxingia vulgaris TaxID=2600176 RepID=A0A5C6WYS0_9DELT|nr:hypothetical protein [Lujinxingia vulgaris]TXD34662.1 hypothetical protein FRC96_13700 [Lujinxingia vulgaris]